MADQSQQDFDNWLTKANKILETNNSLMGAQGRATKSQIEADADLIKQIKANAAAYGVSNKNNKIEIEQTVDKIKKQRAQMDQEEKNAAKSDSLSAKRNEATGKLTSAFGDIASHGSSMTYAFADADKAFTSAIPTLDLVANTFKTLADVVGSVVAGIPVIGGIGTAAAKATSAVIDFASGVAKAELEMTQQYVDSYKSLTAHGVTLGSQLGTLGDTASAAGLDIKHYNEFVTKNISSLAKLNGRIEDSAEIITTMGRALTENNPELQLMYGGINGVNSALADYTVMMQQNGITITKDNKNQQKGAEDYLRVQKALAEITGQTVEDQKKVRDDLQRDIAWKLMMRDLDVQGQRNAMTAYQLILSSEGQKSADIFKEKMSHHGQVFTDEAMETQALNQHLRKHLNEAYNDFTANKGKSDKEFMESQASIADSARSTMDAYAKSQQGLMQVAGIDKTIGTVGEVLSQNIDAAGKAINLHTTVVNAWTDTHQQADKIALGSVALEKSKITQGQQLDKYTREHIDSVIKLTESLSSLQTQLFTIVHNIDLDKYVTGAVDMMGTFVAGANKFVTDMKGADTMSDMGTVILDTIKGLPWEQMVKQPIYAMMDAIHDYMFGEASESEKAIRAMRRQVQDSGPTTGSMTPEQLAKWRSEDHVSQIPGQGVVAAPAVSTPTAKARTNAPIKGWKAQGNVPAGFENKAGLSEQSEDMKSGPGPVPYPMSWSGPAEKHASLLTNINQNLVALLRATHETNDLIQQTA